MVKRNIHKINKNGSQILRNDKPNYIYYINFPVDKNTDAFIVNAIRK